MADYKRMVSYMYQYENGVKKKNVGYARVESKNGQCKITLHMQLIGQLDSIFPVYLIQRDNEEMNLIYLGDSVLKSQIMDSKLFAEEADIMGSGYKLSNMGGILLFLSESVFYATEWDDKLIIAEEVMKALQPKPVMKDTTLNKEAQQVDYKTESKDIDNTDTKVAEVEHSKEDSLTTAKMDKPDVMKEEFLLPKYKLPRGWKTVERLDKPLSDILEGQSVVETISKAAAVNQGERKQQVEEIINKTTSAEKEESNQLIKKTTSIVADDRQEENKQQIEEVADIVVDDKQDESIQSDKELVAKDRNAEKVESKQPDKEVMSKAASMEGDKYEQADPPMATYFFENYPRIYPFEDNEITLCVKIEPKDIGNLSKDSWTLSNNSFLLHGFYSYQHLIFAKINDRFGCRYILGIPGIFHNRERFMARMFGFESFKSIRKRDLRQGDFGYWYITITM